MREHTLTHTINLYEATSSTNFPLGAPPASTACWTSRPRDSVDEGAAHVAGNWEPRRTSCIAHCSGACAGTVQQHHQAHQRRLWPSSPKPCKKISPKRSRCHPLSQVDGGIDNKTVALTKEFPDFLLVGACCPVNAPNGVCLQPVALRLSVMAPASGPRLLCCLWPDELHQNLGVDFAMQF